jgi:hypothetical protein
MHKVLKHNLEIGRFYLYIDRCLELELSVSEKSGLVGYLSQTDHPCFNDLWKDTCDYLWEMGYRSQKFKNLKLQSKKNEGYWVKILSKDKPGSQVGTNPC